MDRVRDRADLGDLGAELAPRAAARPTPADGHRTHCPRAGAQLFRMARTRLPQACRRFVLAAVTGVLCLVVASPAVAHQPHVVGDAARVAVSDPEISKAYYGRLPSVPARYEIVSRRPFTLYAQTTVPDISGARRDYRLTILGPDGPLLAQLSTPTSHWKQFFEPFGGDHYLTGPEYRRHVPAGHYIVQVTRPGNRGTYVLAIGEAEQWGPNRSPLGAHGASRHQARLLSPVRPAGLADPHRSSNGRPRRTHPAGRMAAEQAHPPTGQTSPSNGQLSQPHHRCPCSSEAGGGLAQAAGAGSNRPMRASARIGSRSRLRPRASVSSNLSMITERYRESAPQLSDAGVTTSRAARVSALGQHR
jgi:hypothetical protein